MNLKHNIIDKSPQQLNRNVLCLKVLRQLSECHNIYCESNETSFEVIRSGVPCHTMRN